MSVFCVLLCTFFFVVWKIFTEKQESKVIKFELYKAHSLPYGVAGMEAKD